MPVKSGISTCFGAMHQVENSRRMKFLFLHFMHWINTQVEWDGMEYHMRISYKILAKITTVVRLWWQKAIQRISISLSITFEMCTAQAKIKVYPLLRLDLIATVHWNADETDDNIVALPSLLEFINNLWHWQFFHLYLVIITMMMMIIAVVSIRMNEFGWKHSNEWMHGYIDTHTHRSYKYKVINNNCLACLFVFPCWKKKNKIKWEKKMTKTTAKKV